MALGVKKSAADIEALRWWEMFQAFACGMFAEGSTGNGARNTKILLENAAIAADTGMILFHERFEKEPALPDTIGSLMAKHLANHDIAAKVVVNGEKA